MPLAVGAPTSTNITATSATLGGNVSSDGGSSVTGRGVVLSRTSFNSNPLIGGTDVTKINASASTGVFTVSASNLTSETAYTFKAFVTNATGTVYSAPASFTTLSSNALLSSLALSTGSLVPAFSSGQAQYTSTVPNATSSLLLTATSANANASISINGAAAAIGTSSGTLSLIIGRNDFTVSVTSQDGTNMVTYMLTIYRSALPPSVNSPTATVSGVYTPTLGGNVASDGGSAITERGFVFSVASVNGDPLLGGTGTTKKIVTGSTGVFSAGIDGLQSGTTYAYKAYATNNAGTGYSALAQFTTLTGPDITVQQPAGVPVVPGGTKAFGTTTKTSPISLTFTISNPGSGDLSALGISIDGTNAADFTTSPPSSTLVKPGESTSFTVHFTPSPGPTGNRTANLHITSNAPSKNPYDIVLSGLALSFTTDSDNDGLNDASEFDMSSLNFNWQQSQIALVNTYNQAANGAGLFRQNQLQALHPEASLVGPDPETGRFALTLRLKSSSDLVGFSDFPIPASSLISITPAGTLKFEVSPLGNTAFFLIKID
ncbi:cadherin-like beta sandwich domain-containing protein [Luteolibacter soli]|uniref:Cadherin-like beta sandwich domain-containing protein n=1 Tax=Luteolibacter soli TaxID=3135280 RepID=A0ABU9AQJ0_9BACT